MRFFLDHDIPVEIARVLRREGHEVVELRQAISSVSTDKQVLAHAAQQKMLLITCNRDDFLALVTTEPNPGLIVLIRRTTRQSECAHLLRLLDRAGEAGLAGSINFA